MVNKGVYTTTAPTVTGLQHLLSVCERELVELDMHVNVNKSMYVRFGQRSNVQCADLSSIHGGSLKWVNSCRYLGVHFVNGRTLKCSFDSPNSKFYRAFNAIYSKVVSGDSFSFATCQVFTYTTIRDGSLSDAVARQTFLGIHHHTSHEHFSHWLL